MDKEQKIKDMAQALLDTKETISSQDVAYYKSSGFKKFGCYYRMAEKLVDAGYGDVRYAVKEVLNKVFRYVEEARLECEFQDKDGKWYMDESEFMCEFTLGKLHELYREYGIEMFTGSEQANNEKEMFGDEVSKNDKEMG